MPPMGAGPMPASSMTVYPFSGPMVFPQKLRVLKGW